MNDDDYYMKKTRKVCPMCMFYVGPIPIESIKLCLTHQNKETPIWITKGKEVMTQDEAIRYQGLGILPSKPYKKGGWRTITKEKKDEVRR